METAGKSDAAAKPDSAIVMACGICEVTWRGRPGDCCWACGHSAHTVIAPPMQVKVPAPA